MEFLIGAGLVAAGLLIARAFDHFWPSPEAERQREAALEREERDARRRYRSELAKPIIAALDRAASMAEMRSIVSSTRARKGAPLGSADMVKFEENLKAIPDDEHNQRLAEDLRRLFFEETPLIFRIHDGHLRYLVLSALIGARSGAKHDTMGQITKAYHGIGRWISAADDDEAIWAGDEDDED